MAFNCCLKKGPSGCFNGRMDLATTYCLAAVREGSTEKIHGQDTLSLVRNTSLLQALLATIPTGPCVLPVQVRFRSITTFERGHQMHSPRWSVPMLENLPCNWLLWDAETGRIRSINQLGKIYRRKNCQANKCFYNITFIFNLYGQESSFQEGKLFTVTARWKDQYRDVDEYSQWLFNRIISFYF